MVLENLGGVGQTSLVADVVDDAALMREEVVPVADADTAPFISQEPDFSPLAHRNGNGNGIAHSLASPLFRSGILDRARETIGARSPEAYRPSIYYYSPDPREVAVPIIPGISKTTDLFPKERPPRVLFLLHFPPQSNGSGFVTRAMAQHFLTEGIESRILFAGDHFDPSGRIDGVGEYLVPFASPTGNSLNGAASAHLPVIDGNPASPMGVRFKDMTADELTAYTEGYSDCVKQAVRDFLPDILVVGHALFGAEAARRTGLPYAVICHGTCNNHISAAFPQGPQGPRNENYPANFGDLVFPGMLRANLTVTANSEVAAALPRNYGISADDVITIPHGFSGEIFRPQPDLDRDAVLAELGIARNGTTHVVSYAGRMATIKGVDILIRAASVMRNQVSEAIFILAGDGGQMDEYKALVRKLRLEKRVFFVGNLPQEKVARLFAVSDLVVAPSRSELFGLAALEAAGCGTPVIASDLGGLRQVVSPAIGFLFKPEDPRDLAAKITRHLRADAKAAMGESAAKHARGNFSWSYTAGELLHQLRRILEKRREKKNARAFTIEESARAQGSD